MILNVCFWPEAAIGFAENHANRIAALRAEAAIGPTELSIAAFDRGCVKTQK